MPIRIHVVPAHSSIDPIRGGHLFDELCANLTVAKDEAIKFTLADELKGRGEKKNGRSECALLSLRFFRPLPLCRASCNGNIRSCFCRLPTNDGTVLSATLNVKRECRISTKYRQFLCFVFRCAAVFVVFFFVSRLL